MKIRGDKTTLNSWLYLTPPILLVVVFYVAPLIFMLLTSMTDWTAGRLDHLQFVGLANYRTLFANKEFWTAVRNTFLWIGAAVFIQVPLCLLVAIILCKKPRFWKFFRTVYFIPNILAQFSMAWMWLFLFKPDIGLVNALLRTVGLESLATNWLGNPNTALGALIFTWIFNVGYFTMIFMAQIGTIPEDIYEAARLDGANEWDRAVRITIPMLKNTILIVVLLCVTMTFKTFEGPFVMTRGGPGTSTMILPLMMYNQMLANRCSVSNALGVVMVAIGVIVVFAARRLFADRDEKPGKGTPAERRDAA